MIAFHPFFLEFQALQSTISVIAPGKFDYQSRLDPSTLPGSRTPSRTAVTYSANPSGDAPLGNPITVCQLLRAHDNRPRRRAAEQRDELASLQPIELHPRPLARVTA